MASGSQLVPRMKSGRPLTLNVRDLSGVSVVEVISRMPKRVEIESLTLPSNSTFSVRSYSSCFPLFSGHHRRGLRITSCGNSSGVKTTCFTSPR